MRPRWIILGLFLTGIVYGTITWWPERPMWIRPVEQNSRILGFCTERNSILISEHPPVHTNEIATLVEKDVETGNELRRLKLPIEKNFQFRGIHVLPGTKKLFVAYRYVDHAKNAGIDPYASENQLPHFYRILDITSGDTLAGPFPFEGDSSWVPFSPDGQWFWCYNPKTETGYDVLETTTGRIIQSFRAQSGRRLIHKSSFSPDSSAIAVHWYHKTGQHELEVYDLPTGKKRFAHLFPLNAQFNWLVLSKWDGDRIFMEAEALVVGTKTHQQLFFSFQVLPDRLGGPQDESKFTGYWEGGGERRQFSQVYGDRLVQVTTMPLHERPIVVQNVLAWFDKTIGTKWSEPVFGSTHLGFFDRVTGKPLYDLSSSELRWGFMGGLSHDGQRLVGISEDGRRVTSMYPLKSLMEKPHPQFGLMMWDADPFPRWPWALAAGLGTLLLILLLGRWRSKQLAAS